MNSQAPCPRKGCDGMVPVDIAPAEPDVGIMGSYLDDVGTCEECGYKPAEGRIAKLEEQAIDALCDGPEWEPEEER